jgi:hypothetical protein
MKESEGTRLTGGAEQDRKSKRARSKDKIKRQDQKIRSKDWQGASLLPLFRH